METIKIGQKAPDFKLVGTDLEPISLKNYKGKNLIVHFFPLAFTTVCTAQMCTARDGEHKYNDMKTEVLGVSVDSPFVLRKFADENDLKFAMGSDFNREASKAFGVLYEDDFAGMTHFSKRSAFVIDKEGIVRYAEVTDGKTLPDFNKIAQTIAEL